MSNFRCATYRVVRFYASAGIQRRVIEEGLTLQEAQDHCRNPESSSRTCTGPVGKRRTKQVGAWFDGYEEEHWRPFEGGQ